MNPQAPITEVPNPNKYVSPVESIAGTTHIETLRPQETTPSVPLGSKDDAVVSSELKAVAAAVTADEMLKGADALPRIVETVVNEEISAREDGLLELISSQK